MVAVPTDKLRRVEARQADPVFQSPTSIDAPSGAFGNSRGLASLGKSLSGAGDELGRLVVQMAEDDNETAAKEADSRIAERIRRITMGDPADSAFPGYMNSRGHDSLDTFGDAEEAIRAVIAEELEGAKENEHLAALITDKATRRVDNALDRMTGHASEQRLQVQEAASLAREAQAFADVTADWQSDTVLSDALKIVQAEVLDRADAQGMPEEVVEALLLERQSVIVKGVFDAALASEDVGRAQAVFSQHAERLDGPTRNIMAKALGESTRLATAQSLADEAMLLFPNNPAAARKHIRDSSTGKVRSSAMDEFNGFLRESRGDSEYARSMQSWSQAQADRQLPVVAQTIVEEAQGVLGDGATPGQLRQYIQSNYSGREEETALALLQQRVERSRSDRTADQIEEDRQRTQAAQIAVQDAYNAVGRDASPARIREYIESAYEDRQREDALDLYQEQLNRQRGDIAEEEQEEKRTLPERAQTVVEDLFKRYKDLPIDEAPAAIREEIFKLEGSLQDEAFRQLESILAAQERDESRARTRYNASVTSKAQALFDEVVSRDDLSTSEMRKLIHDQSEDEVREAASRMFEQYLNAERADESARRAAESEARAIADHEYSLQERLKREQLQAANVAVYSYLYADRPSGSELPSIREFRAQNPAMAKVLEENGRMDQLQVTFRNVREGRIYATSSDGETLKAIKLMPPSERAKIEPVIYRDRLTENEYNQAVASVASAQRMLESNTKDRAIYNAGFGYLEEFAPTGFDPKKQEKARVVFDTAKTQMEEWISERLEVGEIPSAPEMRKEAARLMGPLMTNTGWFDGLSDFDGYVAQYRTLPPEQQAIVRVPYDQIPEEKLAVIADYISSNYTGIPKNRITEDVFEEIAGAVSVNDTARVRRILEKLGGTYVPVGE